MMGPERMTESVEIGLFNDPDGHLVGVVRRFPERPVCRKGPAPAGPSRGFEKHTPATRAGQA
jgi:hypothetical protein